MSDAGTTPPVLRVLRGEPTAEELAALVAVVGARSAPSAEPGSTSSRARSAWSDPARAVREPVRVGPGGWVSSGRPR